MFQFHFISKCFSGFACVCKLAAVPETFVPNKKVTIKSFAIAATARCENSLAIKNASFALVYARIPHFLL